VAELDRTIRTGDHDAPFHRGTQPGLRHPSGPFEKTVIDAPPGHRQRTHHRPSVERQPLEVNDHRVPQRDGQLLRARRKQLLREERVPLGPLVQAVEDHGRRRRAADRHHVVGELRTRERSQVDGGHACVAAQLYEIRAQRMGAIQIVRAIRRDDRQPLCGGRPHKKAQQIARRAVRPVQILHHQHHRPVGAEPAKRAKQQFEQLRAARPRRHGRRHRVSHAQLGHKPRDLLPARSKRSLELVVADLSGERAQGAGDRRERELSVPEIDATAEQHERPTVPRSTHQFFDQPALADARLARDNHRRRVT
jgi:hypothetical protein